MRRISAIPSTAHQHRSSQLPPNRNPLWQPCCERSPHIYRVQKYIGHGSALTTERYYLRYLTEEEKARVSADGDNGFR